jgi:hypothetical protein
MTVIDTLEIADELSRDGVFTREQPERLARLSGRAATETLASKDDIAILRAEITALRGEIAGFKAEVATEFARTRADLEHAILVSRREVEVRILEVNKETMKWITGMLLTHGVAVIGVTVALIRLL